MARLNNKIILAEGDSWTAGDIVDPNSNITLAQVNEPSNDAYRLPRVWPDKLGKRLRTKVLNNAVAGSSNQAIVQRTTTKVVELLETYKPEDIYVIVGWSSPERQDFYYSNIEDERASHWETLYPAQIHQGFNDPGKLEFYKLFIQYFWNEPEFILRFINHHIQLHYFLKSLGVKHKFFNAFYESKMGVKDTDLSFMVTTDIYHVIFETIKDKDYFRGYFGRSNPMYYTEILKSIYQTNIFNQSFSNFIKTLQPKNSLDKLIDNFHPSEFSHSMWAKHLHKELTDLVEWCNE